MLENENFCPKNNILSGIGLFGNSCMAWHGSQIRPAQITIEITYNYIFF
jgi:hypothetical protein